MIVQVPNLTLVSNPVDSLLGVIDDEACSSAPRVGVAMSSCGSRWSSQWRVDGVCGIWTSEGICCIPGGLAVDDNLGVRSIEVKVFSALTKASSSLRLPRAGQEDHQRTLKTSQGK